MVSRASWVSVAAASGSGLLVFWVVVVLLDRILPTLPRFSISLAWIPGSLVGAAASYGVWVLLRMALRSASWADFRAELLRAWVPFDPGDHGGKPRQGHSSLSQIAQEIQQTQLQQQKVLNRIEQQVQAEIQICKRAQAQLRGEQQWFQALQAQAQQMQQHLGKLCSQTLPKSNQQRELRHKIRQLQSQITNLKLELERQKLQLQQSEAERVHLQKQQRKLKRLLQRTQVENQELRSQQDHLTQQAAQVQQELRTLQSSWRALQVLQEIEVGLQG
ncbi:MAG: hypothetical protein Q6K80_07480 [Thermostichus sp. DG_1_6_bins_120]